VGAAQMLVEAGGGENRIHDRLLRRANDRNGRNLYPMADFGAAG
jgi:hypothetical protein